MREVQLQLKVVSPESNATVSVGEADSISKIKEAVASSLLIPATEQVLLFKGRPLLDTETVRGAGLDEKGVSLYVARLPQQNMLRSQPLAASRAGGMDGVAQASMASFSWLWEESEESETKEAEEAEKSCRICHEGSERQDAGALFSPCSCTGSMRYVHVDCLNQWRALSTNSNSYYRCDQCHYQYNLQRTEWAQAVQSPQAVEGLTLLVCVLLVLLTGLPAYFLNVHTLFYEWVEWVPPWHSHSATPQWLRSYSTTLDFVASGTVTVAFAALGQDLYHSFQMMDQERQARCYTLLCYTLHCYTHSLTLLTHTTHSHYSLTAMPCQCIYAIVSTPMYRLGIIGLQLAASSRFARVMALGGLSYLCIQVCCEIAAFLCATSAPSRQNTHAVPQNTTH
jgi:hypothetical protein